MIKSTRVLREYFRYSSLNVLGMIGLSCYILADTYFVANGLGVSGLAALNLAIPVYSLMYGAGQMLGIGGANRYSLLRGRGQDANTAFSYTLAMAAVCAVIFELLGFLSGNITAWLGADEDTFEMCRTYIRTLMLFSPAFLLNNLVIAFVRSDGAPQLAMAGMLSGSFSNIALDYLFLFPLHMGMFGAVLATCMAPLISIGVLSSHFWRGKNGFHVQKCRVSGVMCRNILTDGVPALVTELSSGFVMILFNCILLHLGGNDGVAAYGVISNLSLVVLAMFNGVAQGIQPIVGRYHGSGNFLNAEKIRQYAVTTVIALSALLYAGIFFGADPITAAFNSEGNAIMQQLAVHGLRIYFTACPFAGLNIVLSAYLTASDRPRLANTVSILRGFAVIIPLTFLLSAVLGVTGLWLAFPVTELTVSFAGVWMAKRNHTKKL